MALYESTFIARQELSEQDVTKLTETFSAGIKGSGGKVVKSEYWGLRSLSYPINKSKKGHYVHLGIEGKETIVAEINKGYKKEEDVVRTLTIKVDEISKDPSAILRPSEDSDDSKKQARY